MRAESIRGWGRISAVFGVVLLVATTLATSVEASHAYVEISIPIDTIVKAEKDSTTQLATADVPEGFDQHMCMVAAHAENQESVHPGNDLVVASGASQVVLPDVEASPRRVVEATELLELADVITVSLIMGKDGIFSAGIDVVVECHEEETTTTTTIAEVSPTEVTTTTTAEVEPTEVTTTTTAEVSPTDVSTTVAPTSTSIADEVLGTEVLPFTGIDNTELGLLGLALLAGGVLIVVGIRRTDS